MTTPRSPSRSRRLRSFFGTVLLVLAVCSLAGCQDEGMVDSGGGTNPVILIALDGLEWNVVLDMLARERLPTLAGLMRRGRFGELEVTKPTLSPIIWTSIATGVDSRTHGIRGFVHGAEKRLGEDGLPSRLYTSNDRRVKAFWNIASEAGRRVHVIGWWLTYPVEAINGVMVAQVNIITPRMRREGRGIWKGNLFEGVDRQVHPPEREPALLSILGRVEAEMPAFTRTVFGELPQDAPGVAAAFLEQSMWAFRGDALYHRVTLDVLRNDGPFDLLAVYLGGADVVGHRFWRHAYPELYRHPPGEDEAAAFGKILESYYAYLDGVLASILAMTPPNANVIVVSDHGMGPVHRNHRFKAPALSGGHLSGPPALLLAAGPDIRPRGDNGGRVQRREVSEVGSVLDVTPTLLALLGIPVGREMKGDVLIEILAPEFRATHPTRYVARHTPADWFASRPKPPVDPSPEPERIGQLRALGYLGD